jgi:hypothetical protein
VVSLRAMPRVGWPAAWTELRQRAIASCDPGGEQEQQHEHGHGVEQRGGIAQPSHIKERVRIEIHDWSANEREHQPSNRKDQDEQDNRPEICPRGPNSSHPPTPSTGVAKCSRKSASAAAPLSS